MKRFYCLPLLAMLFISFCGNQKLERPMCIMCITKAEINLHIQSESLRVAVERRLQALEAQEYAPAKKPHPARRIDAVRASDPIRQ